MSPVAERHEPFVAVYDALKTGAAAGPGWLRASRDDAMRQFADRGFPTTRHEDWKFTNITPIVETTFAASGPRPTADQVASHLYAEANAYVAVVAAGTFAPDLSALDGLPTGVTIGSLAEAVRAGSEAVRGALAQIATGDHPFTWLNTGLFADGVFVHVPAGVIVERPLQIHVASDAASQPVAAHPRVLIVAGENSQISIIESYGGPEGQKYFTNAVTEVSLAPGAIVHHVKVQRESRKAFHVAGTFARLGRGSVFSSHSISLGGGIVRNDISAVLDGEGGEATLNGLYIADGDRLVDNHTVIDHAKAHCPSHEVYKGVLGGKARAVFNGKIFVREDAQKTNAKQTNKALLLSDDAQINTKPQLEIFADDVKCTHGAAIGQLDEDALFYLRARGIGRHEARDFLIRAFAGEVLQQVKPAAIHDRLEQLMLDALPRS
ncbi:MAG: Fe-S cluster assembly protein SufD [Acidobacteriota bacterium]|nr:Fe-S cluster assembly protein SufD [Acidobacteriota bacterium]